MSEDNFQEYRPKNWLYKSNIFSHSSEYCRILHNFPVQPVINFDDILISCKKYDSFEFIIQQNQEITNS